MKKVALMLLVLFVLSLATPVRADTELYVADGLMIASAVYDTETFLHARKHPGIRVYEGNPVLKPFMERGRVPAYLAMAAVTAGEILITHKLHKEFKHGSHHKRFGQGWAIFPGVVITTHGVAGTLNLRF